MHQKKSQKNIHRTFLNIRKPYINKIKPLRYNISLRFRYVFNLMENVCSMNSYYPCKNAHSKDLDHLNWRSHSRNRSNVKGQFSGREGPAHFTKGGFYSRATCFDVSISQTNCDVASNFMILAQKMLATFFQHVYVYILW